MKFLVQPTGKCSGFQNHRKSLTKVDVCKLSWWKAGTKKKVNYQENNITHTFFIVGDYLRLGFSFNRFSQATQTSTISINTLCLKLVLIPTARCIFVWIFMQAAPSSLCTSIEPESGINHYPLLKMHCWCPSLSAGWPALQAKAGTCGVSSQAAHRLGLSGLNGSEWWLNGELVGIWLGAWWRYGRPHPSARTCWGTDLPL